MKSLSHPIVPNTTSKSDPVVTKHGIHIRYFRPVDAPQVRELFMLAMANGPGSPRRLAMTKTLFNLESYICYIFIVIGLALFTLSPKHRALGAVLMVGITSLFLRNRRMMSRWFIDYCLNALREDLANIATYYGLEPTSPSREEFAASGPSAFWVVECVSRDGRGTEIVGCIGLDCQKKDGIIRGELRRMAVSPHYRGMGIAGLLVKTLIAHAKKNRLPTVWLGTTEFQRPAIDMYKKHGWVQAREYVRVRFGLIKFAVLNFRLDLIPT